MQCFDFVRGQAGDSLAEKWCMEAWLHKSFTTSIAAHGEALALLICNAWCARMSWVYETSILEGRDFVLSAHVCFAFREDPEIQIAFAAVTQSVQKRIVKIRELVPQFMPVGAA